MSAFAGSQRHPFEVLLEQLTGRMSKRGAPVQHRWGTRQDAEISGADRVIWIPVSVEVIDVPYVFSASIIPSGQACVFDVAIYGQGYLDVIQSHEELVGAIDILVGPSQGAPPSEDGTRPYRPGYRIGKSEPFERGADGALAGWSMLTPITLFKPIYSAKLPLAEIQSVSIGVFASEEGTEDEASVVNP